jgi:hypothetical protein
LEKFPTGTLAQRGHTRFLLFAQKRRHVAAGSLQERLGGANQADRALGLAGRRSGDDEYAIATAISRMLSSSADRRRLSTRQAFARSRSDLRRGIKPQRNCR